QCHLQARPLFSLPASRFPLPALFIAAAFCVQSAAGQSVLLQIRPHIGDTLRMHLSQSVEMTGTNKSRGRDSTTTMTTSIEVYTRAIPNQWTSTGTLMQAITDSIKMTPTSQASIEDLRRRSMQARPVWLRVSTDGAIEIVDDADPNSELRHLFGEMPAMLARKAVAVGEKWSREMQIPLSGDPGTVGEVKATFRLDSLGRNGDIAYISMQGTMSRANAPSGQAQPTSRGYMTSGTLSGTIQIDRRLGWITDSKSSIIVRSTIAQPPARKGEPQSAPMQVRTKITQWIRVMRER
ncbi:MAG TPA: DUF6263 family protein, partial [Gemmatimonadaceae bacterium]